MNTGQIISGIGHAALISWVLFGGLFLREQEVPAPAVSEVTMISEAEFAALTAPAQPPSVAAETETPEPPQPDAAAPAAPAGESSPETAEAPVPEAAPEPEAQPETLPEPLPPQASVEEEAPESPEPPAPDPGALVAALPDAPPKPRPAPRVAPEAAPEPPPEAEAAPEPVPEVAPAEEPAEVVEEERPPAQPEEATTEIVTEAEKPSAAPVESLRPKSRPKQRPVQVAEAEPEAPKPAAERPAVEEPDRPGTADAVDAAMSEALGEGTAPETPERPTGPPLTSGEKGEFALAVRRCWVVDPGSEAARVIVSIRFEMNPDGTVNSGSLKMVNATEGSDAAVKTAFESARRAILRCGAQGYDLPAEKFDQWKLVTINFDPNDVRMR